MNDFSKIKLKYRIVKYSPDNIELEISIITYPKWFKDIDFYIQENIMKLGKRSTFAADRFSMFFHGSTDFKIYTETNTRTVIFYDISQLKNWIKNFMIMFYKLSNSFEKYLETDKNILKTVKNYE